MDSLKNDGLRSNRAGMLPTARHGLVRIQEIAPQLTQSLQHHMVPTALRQAQALNQVLSMLHAAQPKLSASELIAMHAALRPVFFVYAKAVPAQDRNEVLQRSLQQMLNGTHRVCLAGLAQMVRGLNRADLQSAHNERILSAMRQVLGSVFHEKTLRAGEAMVELAMRMVTLQDQDPQRRAGRPKTSPSELKEPALEALARPSGAVGLMRSRPPSMSVDSNTRMDIDRRSSSNPRSSGSAMVISVPRVNAHAKSPATELQPPAFMHVRVPDAKRSVPQHVYRTVASLFGNHRFSFLRAERDLGILTPSVASGAWGKVRFLLTEKNEVLAVKELRTQFKPGKSKFNRTKTRASELDKVQEEVTLTVTTRDVVDRGLRRAEFAKLAIIRSALTPFVISRMITDALRPKAYVVMNREAGTLADLQEHVATDLRAMLALSVGAQGFVELGLFHVEAQTTHMDIKADNVLVSKDGQMKLMDLGLAGPLVDKKTAYQGVCGSIISPEMLMTYRDDGELEYLGVANDVWALGVVVAALAAPAHAKNPFQPSEAMFRVAVAAGLNEEEFMMQAFVAYQVWGDLLRGGEGRIDVRQIKPDGLGTFNDFFATVAAQNPELCDLLVNEALVLHPNDRAGAAYLGRRMMGILPDRPTQAFEALRGAASALERSNGVDQLIEHAIHFRTWERETQAADIKVFQHLSGYPRALPG